MLKLELELNIDTFELGALMLKLELVINIEIETFWVLCSALCFDINLLDINYPTLFFFPNAFCLTATASFSSLFPSTESVRDLE